MRSLQEADVIALHRWPDWPRAPIFLSQSLGYWPSRETITAQLALITVYAVGALYMFVLRPQLRRSTPAPVAGAGMKAQKAHEEMFHIDVGGMHLVHHQERAQERKPRRCACRTATVPRRA